MVRVDFYATAVNRDLEHGKIPNLSHDLESVRAYQWELVFNAPTGEGPIPNGLTLAAKQVSPVGHVTEDIVADRVNDRYWYPGKTNAPEMTVVFDNQIRSNAAQALYEWYQNTYDPVTGQMTKQFIEGNGVFKVNAQLFELNNQGVPFLHTHLYGVYPKSWQKAEHNYSTNEFHTIEVIFRYDFAVHEDNPNA